MSRGAPDLVDVKLISRKLNERVGELAPDLLPNGRRSACRRFWETNGLDDNPKPDGGMSLKVNLSGAHIGQWRDFAASGPDADGDMIDLARLRRFGGNKGEAVAWAKSYLGLDGMDPDRIARVRFEAEVKQRAADLEAEARAEQRKRGARALFLSAGPMEGSPAARYLTGRGIDPRRLPNGRWPGSLRFHDQVWNGDTRTKLPAMVATMVTPEGVTVAAHRTYLGRDPETRAWVKADAAATGVQKGNAKKVLGRCGGAFVPIAKGASGKSMGELVTPEPVYVTEGIEDALTVSMVRPELRIVAAYSISNMGGIVFPETIDPVVIVADRDEKPAAIDALERTIARLQAGGKTVQIVMPPVGFKDMNAWLTAGGAALAQGRAA